MPPKATIFRAVRAEDRRGMEVFRQLAEEIGSAGFEVDPVDLGRLRIAPCTGCFGCWVRTPGICVIDDAGRETARAALRCDLLVFLTPIAFGGYSSELKKAVDRMLPLLSPFFTRIGGEIHHLPRYPVSPSVLGVGLLDRPDPERERIFRTLVARNALNYHSPRHAAVVVADGALEGFREQVASVLREGPGR